MTAQIERSTRQNRSDIADVRRALGRLDTVEKFRAAVRATWQISLLARRVHLEYGQRQGDPEVRDALTLDALERTVVEL